MKSSNRYYYTLLTAAIWLLLSATTSIAQNQNKSQLVGIIKGVVIDSANKNRLSAATIIVTDPLSNQNIRTTISNNDGSFEITSLPYKRFQLSITSVGYKPKIIQLPSFTSSIIFIGNVSLTRIQNQLKDVVVTGKKQLVEHQNTKVIYNVFADPDSKTSNAFDIMRKVPRLTVDGDDKLQLNGSTNYRVLINGRTSSLFVRNANDVFKTMPANLIMKIEVISNPPARYEAEGIGGIINIITYKKRIDGYNGSVTAAIDNIKGPNVGGFVTAKKDKLGTSINLGNSINHSPTSTSLFTREDKTFFNYLKQSGRNNSKNTSTFFSADVSYDIDSLNLITSAFSLNDGNGNSSFNQNVELQNRNRSIIQSYKNNNTSTNNWSGTDIGFDYQRSFKKSTDKLLTLSYKSSNNNNSGRTDIRQIPLVNYYRNDSYSKNGNTFKEQTLQADYVQPVKQNILEIGLKSIVRKNNSNYSYATKDTITGKYAVNERLGNNFDNKQVIDAAYISVITKYADWAITAGTRIESTKTNASFKTSGTIASQQHVNVLPSISLSRQLDENGSVSLAYNQRIERPSIYFLDPFVDISDPRNIYFGNPDLAPAISNQFSIAYFTFYKTASINGNVFYSFSNNSIERFTALNKDTTAYTTYGNIGRNRSFGVSLSSNVTLVKKLNVAVNTTTNYLSYSSVLNGKKQNNDGLTFDGLLYINYRFEKNWRASTSINYNSASVLFQGSQAGYISNNFAATKEFLKNKKASLGLTINNPFQTKRLIYRKILDPTFKQIQQSEFTIRSLNLAFNYRFGKLQEDISRKKRGIKNDDLKTSD
ncbi:MAG TPA: outer membrane beta-barrel family protein [Segetibacter sp.]